MWRPWSIKNKFPCTSIWCILPHQKKQLAQSKGLPADRQTWRLAVWIPLVHIGSNKQKVRDNWMMSWGSIFENIQNGKFWNLKKNSYLFWEDRAMQPYLLGIL